MSNTLNFGRSVIGKPVVRYTKAGASIQERFLARIVPTLTGCWYWSGSKDADGYGWFSIKKRTISAHRASYEIFVGKIPDGLQLDHLCRTPACVNPVHLEPITGRENTLRGTGFAALNARKTHCPRGHDLSGDNLYITPSGRRACRECRRAQLRASRHRRGIT